MSVIEKSGYEKVIDDWKFVLNESNNGRFGQYLDFGDQGICLVGLKRTQQLAHKAAKKAFLNMSEDQRGKIESELETLDKETKRVAIQSKWTIRKVAVKGALKAYDEHERHIRELISGPKSPEIGMVLAQINVLEICANRVEREIRALKAGFKKDGLDQDLEMLESSDEEPFVCKRERMLYSMAVYLGDHSYGI